MTAFTLSRYFMRRYLVIAAMYLTGIFLLIFIIDATEFMRRMSVFPKYTPLMAAAVSAMRIPMIFLQIVPFVALFAAMSTLYVLNRKYELVVARSTGWLPCRGASTSATRRSNNFWATPRRCRTPWRSAPTR